MKPIIEIDRISKLYHLGSIGAGSLREALGRWWDRRAPADTRDFWALREVSFTVQPGEVIGLVGRNGAGKSTLLKILSRVTEPTSGRAVLRGRAASLLEVGTGFHPDLTGRENIHLNGAILGMKRAEIARKFDDIVEFAEIGPFLDTPVKRYSSGMYVRLAFAVAAHLDPDILFIDEVLAVGDAAFQKKCLGKMQDVASRGRTVIFVSHNMATMQALCDRAVMLENGRVAAEGPTAQVLARYLSRGGEDSDTWARDPAAPASAPLHFESARLRLDGEAPNQMLHLELKLASTAAHRPAIIAVDILNGLGVPVMEAMPTATPFVTDESPRHTIHLAIHLPPLIPGHYPVTLWAGPSLSEGFDEVDRAVGFDIETSPTKDRTSDHNPERGYVVPHCTLDYVPEPAGTAVA